MVKEQVSNNIQSERPPSNVHHTLPLFHSRERRKAWLIFFQYELGSAETLQMNTAHTVCVYVQYVLYVWIVRVFGKLVHVLSVHYGSYVCAYTYVWEGCVFLCWVGGWVCVCVSYSCTPPVSFVLKSHEKRKLLSKSSSCCSLTFQHERNTVLHWSITGQAFHPSQ